MINVKTVDQPSSKRDIFLWILAIVLAVAGMGAYYYFREVAWSLRAAAALVLVCIIVALIFPTAFGQKTWVFIKECRAELRKVVWPTRQEVVQTTLVVAVMVIVMALILWAVDSILLWAVGWFTGQRG